MTESRRWREMEVAAFLEHIRSRYPTCTEWFEKDLPWGEIDGVEVTRIAR